MIDEKRRRRPQLVGLDVLEDSLPAGDDYGLEVAAALRDALAALPRDQAAVVTMRLVQGRPFAEIAREMDTTVEACRMRLVRGLRVLRHRLEDEGWNE